jgi:hypothetical protein
MITGKKFKTLYKDTKFYKLTNVNEYHNYFQYIDGYNEDIINFNPTGKCKPGGFYFTELNKIGLWIKYNLVSMKYIREVEILDYSLVYIEENKFKTNKFILKEKIPLENFIYWNDFDFCNISFKLNYHTLQYINTSLQTEEMCKFALQKSIDCFKYIKLQTKELCKLAVEKNGLFLQYVNQYLQTNEIFTIAVKENGLSLQYIKPELQNKEICKLAVIENGLSLQYVKLELQNEEICMLAIKQNSYALKYVIPNLQTTELCKLAVKKNILSLPYVKP